MTDEQVLRLKEVEEQLLGLSHTMMITSNEIVKLQKELEILKETQHRHDESIQNMYGVQKGIEGTVAQLLTQSNMFHVEVFSMLRKSQDETFGMLESLQSNSGTERATSHKSWMSFIKWLIGVTIVAMVGYMGYLIKQGGG